MKSMVEFHSIDTIEDVATCIRVLASEIGGAHHTPKKAEELLNDLANKLSGINMQMNIRLHDSLTLAGISDRYRTSYLRQQDIKEREQKEAEN